MSTRPDLVEATLWSNVRKQNRRTDPLPYSMAPMRPDEKICLLCGPPFTIYPLPELYLMYVCSFECAKRYVLEIYARPFGYNLTHGKVKTNEGILGREGETSQTSFVFDANKRRRHQISKTYTSV